MISALFREQRPLMVAGLISFLFFILLTAVSLIDPTQILGINRWTKPLKFFISIAIFLWTMAVYFHYLNGYEPILRKISWAMIVIFTIEMVVIAGQPLRRTTSHFNTATPLDTALYAIMGVSIAINAVLVGYVAFLYFNNEIALPTSLIWGMRLGLIVFLLASGQGGYMSAQIGHTVGAADGGAGLPLTNWSTVAGDLRVAHFLGLHSLQAVPIFALMLEHFRASNRVPLTVAFAVVYFALFVLLFVQALFGRPLMSI